MIIAIDGPAGAGKSTVARAVAEALGIAFLDTGAMYRAVTLVVLQRGLDPLDAEACATVAREVELDFDAAGLIRIDGVAGEPDVRSETVTLNVSSVSAHPRVREAVVARQRELALGLDGLVVEGRDTTTVVFPEAEHKFFLVARAEERARRRALQEGRPEEHDVILRDIRRRDLLDTTRAHAPLLQAPDARVIDSDQKDVEAVVSEILSAVGRAPRECE